MKKAARDRYPERLNIIEGRHSTIRGCRSCRCRQSGSPRLRSVFGVDVVVFAFPYEQGTDDHGDQCDHDRIPQAVVDIALVCDQCEGSGWQQTAEPAVTDVVRHGHRCVADAGREHFHQRRCNRTVHHGHIQHQDEQQQQDHRFVHLIRIQPWSDNRQP